MARNRRSNIADILAARSVIINDIDIEPHSCGELNVQCVSCEAKHFLGERPPDRQFTNCCHKGKVELPPIKMCPVIEDLMKNKHPPINCQRIFMKMLEA